MFNWTTPKEKVSEDYRPLNTRLTLLSKSILLFFLKKKLIPLRINNVFSLLVFKNIFKTEDRIKLACALEIQLPSRGSSDLSSFLEK